MESFIVRIYRQASRFDPPEGTPCLVGMLESADGERQRAFRDVQELWRALVDLGCDGPRASQRSA